ncbi:hypothetical protein NGUA41_00066 [Salmonella enterica]|nr:hypothetical protein NGUA41_00066 [Salmonella enterica]
MISYAVFCLKKKKIQMTIASVPYIVPVYTPITVFNHPLLSPPLHSSYYVLAHFLAPRL